MISGAQARVVFLNRLLRAGQIGFAVANFVGVEDFYLDAAVGVGGAAGGGIIAQAGLGAELAVDPLKNNVQVLGRVGENDGSASGVRDGLDRVFTRGVAAAFVFHRAHDDTVEQGVGAHSTFSRGVEIGATGGFSSVGNKDNYATTIFAAAFECARAQQ